jgi:peptide/nickel transport system substrate-binding protein
MSHRKKHAELDNEITTFKSQIRRGSIMKAVLYLTVSMVGLALLAAPAARAQDDACFKIVGYEWSGEKQSMDPADMNSGDDSLHIYSVYNRLFHIDSNFGVHPELAETWSVSDDGLVWTFNLREGVTFHDGSKFDATDVVYTYRRILDPELASSGKPLIDSFLSPESIQAVDDLTVTFTTEKPIVELPLLISNLFVNIVPNGAMHKDLLLHGVGTGPFIQDVFVPNGPVRRLVRNDDYWGGPVGPACLEITVIQEAVASVAAMLSGEVDLLLNVDPTNITVVQDDQNITLLSTAASNSMILAMWIDSPPFDDVRVREALKLVVDRQAMVNTVLLGFGEVGADNPVPLGSPVAYVSEAPAQDIERAKELLAEAGYGDGLELDLTTADAIPGMVKVAQVYAQMAAAAGVTVNVIVTPADSFWDDVWLKKPFITSAWGMRATATGLGIAYTKGADWNETHWYREDYDALLNKAAATIDTDERNAVYMEAQQMLAEEGGVIIPMFIHQVSAIRSACSGFQPHVSAHYVDFENIHCDD